VLRPRSHYSQSLRAPSQNISPLSLTLQAVPLLDLLAAFTLEGFDRLEASAGDGFVAQIPLKMSSSCN
jgi:hypothetical protein